MLADRLILGLGQGKYEIRLEFLVVGESSKEMLKKQKDESTSNGYKGQLKRAYNGQRCNNLSNKVNDVEFDCNPKYTINIHESIPI